MNILPENSFDLPTSIQLELISESFRRCISILYLWRVNCASQVQSAMRMRIKDGRSSTCCGLRLVHYQGEACRAA